MPFKRRQFLLFSLLSGLGLTIFGKLLRSQTTPQPAIPANPVASSTEPLLRFVSVADTGTGARGQYAVATAMARYHQQNPYDLVILAGDNIYNNGEMEKINAVFEKPYQPLLQKGVKFQACLGNHDIRTENGDRQVTYPAFNMKGRYYTFQRGDVQFFVLDTNTNANWSIQRSWLEQELSRSKARWKIVFGHHPIYSSGAYGVTQAFVQSLSPLFKTYNAQLYINGHDHNYERTQVINGTTYLVCGAGAGLRPVGRSSWTAHSAEKLSFAAYEVYADKIVIKGIDTNNRIFDQGVIPLQSA